MRPLTPLLAALLLAGCLADAPAPAAAGDAGAAGTAATDGADAAADVSANAAAPPGTPVVLRVALDGRTPYRACVPSGPSACDSWTLTGGAYVAADAPGTPRAADVTLTWEGAASTPMSLTLAAIASCGDGCRRATHVAEATGGSPLRLQADVAEWPADAELSWGIMQPCLDVSVVYGCIGHEQAYRLEGTLTVEAP